MERIANATVTALKAGPVYTILELCQPEMASDACPGQFLHIKCEGFSLRRPISIAGVTGDRLTLVFETKGGGTIWGGFGNVADSLVGGTDSTYTLVVGNGDGDDNILINSEYDKVKFWNTDNIEDILQDESTFSAKSISLKMSAGNTITVDLGTAMDVTYGVRLHRGRQRAEPADEEVRNTSEGRVRELWKGCGREPVSFRRDTEPAGEPAGWDIPTER